MMHFTTLRSLVRDKLVARLNKRGNPTANWDLGAILSTAADMAKFGITNFDSTKMALHGQQQTNFHR
ncbi:hypothetical protein [Fodinibius sp. SL11]|uniref:hypothetical protein n=1 Tax=Fodinibius sp. SL11 TaxID=3425690 RepID=UPI003F88288E